MRSAGRGTASPSVPEAEARTEEREHHRQALAQVVRHTNNEEQVPVQANGQRNEPRPEMPESYSLQSRSVLPNKKRTNRRHQERVPPVLCGPGRVPNLLVHPKAEVERQRHKKARDRGDDDRIGQPCEQNPGGSIDLPSAPALRHAPRSLCSSPCSSGLRKVARPTPPPHLSAPGDTRSTSNGGQSSNDAANSPPEVGHGTESVRA